MATFRINSAVSIEEICLDSTPKPDGTQKRITLQLAGWKSGSPPNLQGGGNFARLVSTSHNANSRVTSFTIEAVKGAKGVSYFLDGSSADTAAKVLRVTVGPVTNHGTTPDHPGFQSDLIAELLGRSENPVKLWVYQRILAAGNNNTSISREDWDSILADQPLKQITDKQHPERWNCGAALSTFGASYFGTSHYQFGSVRYYKPFKSAHPKAANKMADIEFDDGMVSRGAAKIRHLLEKNIAVTVFVVHDDGFDVQNGEIKPTGDTHYVTIVGCDSAGKTFLFTDPWPGGSRLLYNSGIFGDVNCAFMGLLDFSQRGRNIIATSPASMLGAHRYMVLAGPA